MISSFRVFLNGTLKSSKFLLHYIQQSQIGKLWIFGLSEIFSFSNVDSVSTQTNISSIKCETLSFAPVFDANYSKFERLSVQHNKIIANAIQLVGGGVLYKFENSNISNSSLVGSFAITAQILEHFGCFATLVSNASVERINGLSSVSMENFRLSTSLIASLGFAKIDVSAIRFVEFKGNIMLKNLTAPYYHIGCVIGLANSSNLSFVNSICRIDSTSTGTG